MRFIQSFIISALSTTVLGGLVAIRSPPSTNLDIHPIHERQLFSGLSLGSYDLSTSRENTVLLNITDSVGLSNGGIGAGILVRCISCRTWGQAIISTTGGSKDIDIIGDIIDFFQDPEEAILDAFSIDLKLSLSNVGGHFEFDISALAALSYTIPIYQSLTPVGAAIGDDVSIGIVLSVELVFSVTAGVDLTAGFDFAFPEETYITVDPLTGEIKEDGFLDGSIDPLPITITSGTATFKAALKIKLQAGTTVELFGTGFDFQLGVFANVIEYVATISSTETCDLLITELLDVNIGAFAQSVVTFNFVAIGGSPPIITTVLTIPLPSACITFGGTGAPTTIPLITAGLGSASLTTSAEEAVITPPGGIFVEVPSVAVSTINVVPYKPENQTSESLPSSTSCSSTSISTSTRTGTPYFPLLNTTISTAIVPDFTLRPTSSPSSTPTQSSTSSLTTPPPINNTHPLTNSTNLSQNLTTSTIYTTTYTTICICAQPLINCPSSLASQLTITSTEVLYTTICPIGAILPTTLPASLSSSSVVPTKSALPTNPGTKIGEGKSSLHFVRLETPVVEVLYVPVRTHVSHALPSALHTGPVSTVSAVEVKGTGLPLPSSGVDVGNEVKVKNVKWTFAPSSTSSVPTGSALATGTGGGVFAAKVTVTGGAASSFGDSGMRGAGLVCIVLGLVGVLL